MTATSPARSKHEPRVEDDALVRGNGRFMDDPRLPNQAYAAFVRSPHAHARVLSVNDRRGARGQEVLAVLTAADMKAAGVGSVSRHPPVPGRGGAKMIMPFRPALAGDKVMHGGDPVAMVVAETRGRRAGRRRAGAVDYEELPAVVDLATAMKRQDAALSGSARQPLRRLAGPGARASRTNATWPRSSPRRRMWRASASPISAWWWPRWKRAAPPASTMPRTTATRCTPARRAPIRCAARAPPSWACRTTSCA